MRCGIHVNKNLEHSRKLKGYMDPLSTNLNSVIKKLKINIAQIYTHGPRSTKAIKIDYNNLQQTCKNNGLQLVVHSSYITVAIWNITKKNITTIKTKNILKHFEEQIKASADLKTIGLIVHLPRKTIPAILETMEIIAPILNKYTVNLILEITSTNIPTLSYAHSDNLNTLCNGIIKLKIPRRLWGFCIDTAHMWSAGIVIDSKNKMAKWLLSLKYPEQIKLFHLNGSRKNKFNTGADIHEVALSPQDEIFNKFITSYEKPSLSKIKTSSVYEIIIFAEKNNIPIILEVKKYDEFYVIFLLKIMKKLIDL